VTYFAQKSQKPFVKASEKTNDEPKWKYEPLQYDVFNILLPIKIHKRFGGDPVVGRSVFSFSYWQQ